MRRVVVVLHERLGEWSRQLRPRLSDPVIRWFETRNTADLQSVLTEGVGSPVVVIDLDRQRESGLDDLLMVRRLVSDARVLVVDRNGDASIEVLARELGATCVFVGFVPPPVVARLLARWLGLAELELDRTGFSRTEFPETATDPWSWLGEYVGDRYAPGVSDVAEDGASVDRDKPGINSLDAEGLDLHD